MFSSDYEKVRNEIAEKSKGKCQCDQLDILREALVHLDQVKNTYWSRPCQRDWPCFFIQHRSEIDKIKEQMGPTVKGLERRCETETTVLAYQRTVGETNSSSSSLTSKNTNINNNNGQVLHHPTIAFPKPTV